MPNTLNLGSLGSYDDDDEFYVEYWLNDEVINNNIINDNISIATAGNDCFHCNRIIIIIIKINGNERIKVLTNILNHLNKESKQNKMICI